MAAYTQEKSEIGEALCEPPPEMVSERSLQTLSFTTFSAALAKKVQNNQYHLHDNPEVGPADPGVILCMRHECF